MLPPKAPRKRPSKVRIIAPNPTMWRIDPDERPTRGHPLVEHMQRCGIPVTRENFIALNWPGETPDPWEADHEADLPEELRDWEQFDKKAAQRP